MVNAALTTMARPGIFCRLGKVSLRFASDPAGMALDNVPLFTLLKGKLGHLTQRQRLISQNVANADTPGYVGRDLNRFTFSEALKAERGGGGGGGVVARTHAGHLAGPGRADAVWKSRAAPDSSTTLDGNAVVLEEQMMKMAESRADYEAAVGFYQKSLGLIRLAAKRPGG